MSVTRQPWAWVLSRPGQVVLVMAAYYLVPVLEPAEGARTWLRTAGAGGLFVVAVWWIGREVVRETRASDADARPSRLVLLVLGGVVFFALADLVVARAVPGEFTGLTTKTDALYYALTTLVTVGFGDVHADGQLARALLVVQLAFNAVVLTRAARALSADVARRTSKSQREADRARSPRSEEGDRSTPP